MYINKQDIINEIIAWLTDETPLPRGYEILDWLDKDYKFIVLDDEITDITPVVPSTNVIQTFMETGITHEVITKMEEFFNV
jgi:hypothetical protein